MNNKHPMASADTHCATADRFGFDIGAGESRALASATFGGGGPIPITHRAGGFETSEAPESIVYRGMRRRSPRDVSSPALANEMNSSYVVASGCALWQSLLRQWVANSLTRRLSLFRVDSCLAVFSR